MPREVLHWREWRAFFSSCAAVFGVMGLVVRAGEEGRRKTYELTDKGTRVIQEYLRRLRILLGAGAEARLCPHEGDPS